MLRARFSTLNHFSAFEFPIEIVAAKGKRYFDEKKRLSFSTRYKFDLRGRRTITAGKFQLIILRLASFS